MNHCTTTGITTLAACIAGALVSMSALADGTSNVVQRDVNQQQRIDKMESNALRDGTMSKGETARIEKAEDNASKDIYRQKHDAQVGNPESKSSERMQADVQRNVNQQTRIENGVKSGELTGGETSKVEGQQARVDHREAHAAQDGHVGAGEQARIQGSENRASQKIYRKKHNVHAKPGA